MRLRKKGKLEIQELILFPSIQDEFQHFFDPSMPFSAIGLCSDNLSKVKLVQTNTIYPSRNNTRKLHGNLNFEWTKPIHGDLNFQLFILEQALDENNDMESIIANTEGVEIYKNSYPSVLFDNPDPYQENIETSSYHIVICIY